MPGSASSALPRALSGAARAVPVPGTASPASRRAQPKPEEPAAGSAAPFCPWAPKPAPGPQESGSARPGWERTGEHWPRREKGRSAQRRPSGSRALRYLSVRPGGARGGEGDRPSPPSRLLLGLLPGGGRCPPSRSPCWLSARRRGLGPGAAHRPPHLPPGARVSPPGHSPPQLSALCSPAGNDLRKRLGQGLRQAARARR